VTRFRGTTHVTLVRLAERSDHGIVADDSETSSEELAAFAGRPSAATTLLPDTHPCLHTLGRCLWPSRDRPGTIYVSPELGVRMGSFEYEC
jgi:hypothetical protein